MRVVLEPFFGRETLSSEKDEIAQEDEKAQDDDRGDGELEAFLVNTVLLLCVTKFHGDGVVFTIEDGIEWESSHGSLTK